MIDIASPGIYDLGMNYYHADPCPVPSLSASIARILLQQCPVMAWGAHPRLNPHHVKNNDAKFDKPTVAHELLLNAGRGFEVLAFDDWRTNAAKEAREKALAKGKVAILEHQYSDAIDIVQAAHEQIKLSAYGATFADSQREQSILWQEGDEWCRCRPDAMTIYGDPSKAVIFDYKLSNVEVNAFTVGAHLAREGYDLRSAFYRRGLARLLPALHGRIDYVFMIQFDRYPYPMMFVELGGGGITIGDKMASAAIGMWERCRRTGKWPGYEPVMSGLPVYHENSWTERELNDPLIAELPPDPFLEIPAPTVERRLITSLD